MNRKGSSKQSWPILWNCHTESEFKKARTASFLVEIWTWDLNTKQECYPLFMALNHRNKVK